MRIPIPPHCPKWRWRCTAAATFLVVCLMSKSADGWMICQQPRHAWLDPKNAQSIAATCARHRLSTRNLLVMGSAFDNLGMPSIRPRGSKDEERLREEAAPKPEAPPARRVPELITMNAFGMLIEPSDEIGLFIREVLLKHLDYTVRLPRPECFTKTFEAAYEARKREFPNFGSDSGMSAEEWWAPIFYKTFLDLAMPKDDIDEIFVGVFEELYYEALASDWAWEPVEDILPLLDQLQEWRMQGGPQLGVIVDFDERVTQILENLNILHYFDVVVSTREAGKGKPHARPFQLAMQKAGVKDPKSVMHIGQDWDRDVVGAANVGAEAMWVVMPGYDKLEPEQEAMQISFEKVGDLVGVLDVYEKTDPDRLVTTTWKNRNRPTDLRIGY